jgi:hypothetical protein
VPWVPGGSGLEPLAYDPAACEGLSY